MTASLVIIDGFYADPFDVRAFALRQDFGVVGNFPGRRTRAFLGDALRRSIESHLGLPIDYWPTDTYNGAFQFTVHGDSTWVHADHTTRWSGVLYLTPSAPSESGTAFFRHVQTGLDEYPEDQQLQVACDRSASDWSQWKIVDMVANKFNRLVLFRGRRFHASQNHFGSQVDDGRLFQTFFFNTIV